MNAYDFDGTIYSGDSTLDFYYFIIVRRPAALLDLPAAALCFLKYKLGKCTKTEFKECFFRFLRRVPDIDGELELFWQKNRAKIKPFYGDIRRPDDIVISASPEFLLAPICKIIGVGRLLASRVDPRSGAFLGENCRGEEKVRRFREEFGADAAIDEFYSDSHADDPLARLAAKAYFVKGNTITEWRISDGK